MRIGDGSPIAAAGPRSGRSAIGDSWNCCKAERDSWGFRGFLMKFIERVAAQPAPNPAVSPVPKRGNALKTIPASLE